MGNVERLPIETKKEERKDNMKKRQKVAVLAMSGTLLVAASVMGTMAYLQDQDTVTNTFTVGQVDLTLDEADVKTDGTYVTDHDSRVTKNEYHLIPGRTYYKDPTVTIIGGSEDCYVRMRVEVQNIDNLKTVFPQSTYPDYYGTDNVFLLQNLVGGWDSTVWLYNDYNQEENSTTGVYEFRFVGNDTENPGNGIVVKKDENTVLDDLFETITIPGEGVTNSNIGDLAEVKIVVTAHAIQADGFVANDEKNETAEDVAWAAFDGEASEWGVGSEPETTAGSEDSSET